MQWACFEDETLRSINILRCVLLSCLPATCRAEAYSHDDHCYYYPQAPALVELSVCCSSQATKIIGEPFFHFQLFNIRDQDKNSTTTPRCFDLGLSEFKFLWHHLHQKLISTSAPAAKEEYCYSSEADCFLTFNAMVYEISYAEFDGRYHRS